MKKTAIQVLRIGIPVSIGLYLTWYFWSSMSNADREKVTGVFSRANYFYVFLSLLFCWLSHVSRAMRWKYMLEPMGYTIRNKTSYHAVIIAYFMNLLLPRAGEVSRAGVLTRYEGVPFEKGFGTIMAERVVDLCVMVVLAVITLWLQGEKYPAMISRYHALKEEYAPVDGQSYTGIILLAAIAAAFITVVILFFSHEKFRKKIKKIVRGFADGLLTILRLKKRWQFLAHTFFIWIMYLGLYWICFFSIPETSDIDFRGMLLGFLAGGLSIIIVQGGIGVYPVFVATALSFYCDDYAMLYALGWLAWFAQMGLIVIAGVISLFLISKTPPQAA